MTTIKTPDGSITRGVPPLTTERDAWRLARMVTFMPDPCTPEMAIGHVAVYPDGCVVIAKRGPKGGWPWLRYIDETTVRRYGPLALAKMTREGTGKRLYLGRLHKADAHGTWGSLSASMLANFASAHLQQVRKLAVFPGQQDKTLTFRRYGAAVVLGIDGAITLEPADITTSGKIDISCK